MPEERPEDTTTASARPDKHGASTPAGRWATWLLPAAGLASLVWFLVRVIPKPSRAAYPCQRLAAPLASGFVIWLTALVGSILAFRKARQWLRKARYAAAAAAVAVGVVAAYISLVHLPEDPAGGATILDPAAIPANQPAGVAKGLYAGRVVLVHDPASTSWNGDPSGYWWDPGTVSQAVVDDMFAKGIRWLGGKGDAAAAWDALFRHFNRTRGRGDLGYQAGEKIAVKTNFVLTIVSRWDGSDWASRPGGEQTSSLKYINHSKEGIRALLDQLVNVAGVPQADIYIGDPVSVFPRHILDYCRAAGFTAVHYVSHPAGPLTNREAARFSTEKFFWSTPGAAGKEQDYVPQHFVDAAYLVNFALLKAHSASITLNGKNFYGALLRRPPSSGGAPGKVYHDMHSNLCWRGYNEGYGHYREIVDLMGHRHLGGKTLLCIQDGLYGGYRHYSSVPPQKWRSYPFNPNWPRRNYSDGDWPSCFLFSQDPVAVDSVGVDLWRAEDVASWNYDPYRGIRGDTSFAHWPHMDGGDDYLREAALAHGPASGTFYDPEGDGSRLASLGANEHWNNATAKKYSRNLGTGFGVELVMSPPSPVQACHVFYNNSAFDGNDPAAGASDDAAIAPDKLALRPGGKASLLNYTGYSGGLNGIMIDVAPLPGDPAASDFEFKVGRGGAAAGWPAAPAPTSITVRRGAGLNGSDRVTLIWADGAIAGQWLKVTVKATTATGLTTPETLYFGSAVGETGNAAGDALVTPSDEVCARRAATGGASAGITNVCDINRDGRVDSADCALIRQHATNPTTMLKLITAP